MDPFFSASNLNAIDRSIAQMARGDTVIKTIDELEDLADA